MNIAILLFVFCRFLRELVVIPIYFLKQTVYYLQTGFPSREKAVKAVKLSETISAQIVFMLNFYYLAK